MATMSAQDPVLDKRESFLRSHPVATYFVLAYAISWTAAFVLAAPSLMRHQAIPKTVGLLMFPVMLLGPCLAGIILTFILDRALGLRDLLSQILCIRLPARWYAVLLIPPGVLLTVLLCLRTFVSPVFAPNRFFVGIMFGMVAGFFEEIGWMGYAFPKMRWQHNALTASVSLGLLWAVWHLPVIDYLGTATPHDEYWPRFFLAFTAAMTAMRVLIGWLYTNTKSLFLTQCMHASSTGSLVVLSPPRVTAAQEALWYAIYAVALWIIVAFVVKKYGQRLTRQGP
jgi:membrane protease YdiL (CAAX protease family)